MFSLGVCSACQQSGIPLTEVPDRDRADGVVVVCDGHQCCEEPCEGSFLIPQATYVCPGLCLPKLVSFNNFTGEMENCPPPSYRKGTPNHHGAIFGGAAEKQVILNNPDLEDLVYHRRHHITGEVKPLTEKPIKIKLLSI